MQRGEIYFINFDPVVGREQGGLRPALVISSDTVIRLPLVVTVIPGTKGANVTRDFPTNVRVPAAESGLNEETGFLGFQIRAVDRRRFPARAAGKLSPQWMTKIEDALRFCFEM